LNLALDEDLIECVCKSNKDAEAAAESCADATPFDG